MKKWFTRIVVAGAIVDALQNLGVEYPTVDPASKRRLARARRELQKS